MEAFGNGFAPFGLIACERNVCARKARNREAPERKRELSVPRSCRPDGRNGEALSGILIGPDAGSRRVEGPAFKPGERRARNWINDNLALNPAAFGTGSEEARELCGDLNVAGLEPPGLCFSLRELGRERKRFGRKVCDEEGR